MALLWLRIKQQGMDKYIFCSGEIDSFEKFKSLVKEEQCWVYAGFSKTTGEPVALGMLDTFIGRTARLHYTFFRNPESLQNKEAYAKAFFELLFANRTLDCLYSQLQVSSVIAIVSLVLSVQIFLGMCLLLYL
jgi:hypothetical protein